MGKKQHSKDQLYITQTEWQADWGGKKLALHLPWKTLPYNCCAISFRPFETPMCTKDGSVFDLINIVPYLKKFKRHPVTGDPLAAGDLTKLKFQKNAEGKHHCPVLFKVFNSHTHIVAIKTTGHVYCHEAVKELNVKAKCMRDLIDDTPFTRDDIITLQARLQTRLPCLLCMHPHAAGSLQTRMLRLLCSTYYGSTYYGSTYYGGRTRATDLGVSSRSSHT